MVEIEYTPSKEVGKFYSIKEFIEKYLPDLPEDKLNEQDYRDFGLNLARKSLNNIKLEPDKPK